MKTMADHTKTEPQPQTETNVYDGVYHALLVGMLISSAFFAVGLIRGMLLHTRFPLTPDWVRSHYHVSLVLRGLEHLDPTALMLVATVILILTPVARVIVSIYAFRADGDYKYVAVTSIVLLVMIATFVAAQFGLH
jgi:uncharacterized membrane protein